MLAACGSREPATGGAPAPGSAARGSAAPGSDVVRSPTLAEKAPGETGPGCQQLKFADSTPVPEASGAAWMTLDGVLGLVVVSDSGHDGAFGVLDPATGKTTRQGVLPLGKGASDDIEGLAARDGRLYGLTSSGYVRAWTWNSSAKAFDLVDGPYAIGSGDAVCKNPMKTNCGRDYEGLAIAPAKPADAGACVGFACSRDDGSLYCLVEDGGKLKIDDARRIHVEGRKMSLSDCAFDDAGSLYTGNNLFGLASVHRVDGWSDPMDAKVVELETLGTGFPEVIAVHGDEMYRMSDLGGDGPSLLAKFRCAAKGR